VLAFDTELKNPNSLNVTVSENADALEALTIDIAQEKAMDVLKRQQPEVNWDEIVTLLRNEHRIIEDGGPEAFQAHFKTPSGDIDSVKLAAYERLALVKNTVRSYAPVLLERAYNSDTNADINLLRENVREMRVLGYSYKDVVKFFDQDAKISKSPTPHPTEGLSIDGIKLACGLVESAEKSIGDRENAIKEAILSMICSENFGTKKKFSIMDEAELSDFYARNHNKGVSELERQIEDAIEQEFGQRLALTLDAALRSWDYDSDGKNNADGFAFMAKLSKTTLGALDQIIEAIDAAKSSAPQDLIDLRDDCVKVRDAFLPIYNQAAEITQKLAEIENPKERETYYRKAYEGYNDLEARFGRAYSDVSSNRGFDFYKRALDVLHDSVDALGGPSAPAAQPLDDALRLIARTGFAFEKGQPRQNDFEHIGIINNLFNSPSLRQRGIFRTDELEQIDAAGGFKNLPEDQQKQFLRVLLSHIAENNNRKEILADMVAANPLEFDPDGNGYPLQTRTLLDRLALEKLYQLKFDQNIISDSQPGSDERMHFLFQVFGMQKGTSMSLHEDRGTLPRRAQLLEAFSQSAGNQVITRNRNFFGMILNGTPLDRTSGKDTLQIIHPASDAERGGGFGTRMETARAWRQIADLSQKARITIAQMIGGGMSLNRFGAKPMMLCNTIAEELKDIKTEPFDRRIQQDRHVMRSATALSFTQQGRHKRYDMATASQVACDVARKLSRMIAIRFDLEGLVADNTFIAKKPSFESDAIQSRMDRLWENAIMRYNDMRFAEGSDGKIILNKLAEFVTTPQTISYKNNGARPAAKSGSAKDMTGVRAIENDARFYISQLFAGGFLSAGQMMRDMADDLKEAKITFESVANWIDHPEWDFSVHTKCLIDAGRFDPTYALAQLNWRDATFDTLKEVGEQVRFVKPAGEENYQMVYAGKHQGLSDEQVYFAKIWYDRLLYVSHMEVALNDADEELNLGSNVENIIAAFRPADNSPKFGLGEKVKAKWPNVETILNEHEKNLPQYAIQHMREAQFEEDIKAGKSKKDALERQGGEAALRQSGATYRAGTAPHWPLWSGAHVYGNVPRPPDFKIETVMTQKARADYARLHPQGLEASELTI